MSIKELSVFSGEDCAGCKTVKSVLTERGIKFQVKDIMDSDVMEEAMQLGIRGIPVTVLYSDGKPVEQVVGSSNQAIDRIIEIAEGL
jgi:thioredoxin-like negative regulator of GroEL